MKRKLMVSILFSVLLLWCADGFGQSTPFDLSGYKLPDLERQGLDLYFNVYGDNSLSSLAEGISPRKTGNHSFRNNITGNYFYYLNNERYQRDFRVNFGNYGSLDGTGQPDGDLLQRSRQFVAVLDGFFVNRVYVDGSRFYEYSPNFLNTFSNGYYRNENTNSETETSGISNRFSFNLPLRVGKGRIEPVQDARHAIFIYEALADVNRSSDGKSDEEILDLARFISRLKNMRHFDSRLRRIYELEALDAYLKENNHILNYDGTYFATLNDFWLYGGSHHRMAGERFSIALIPGYIHMLSRGKNLITDVVTSENTSSWLALYGGLEYVREKPINHIWQNSIAANLYGGFSRENHVELEREFTSPAVLLGVSQAWGYYPDTRTSATLSYSLQYTNVFDPVSSSENEATFGSGISGVKAGSQFNINYYITPQFRVSGYFNLGYIWQNSDDQRNIDFYFTPGTFYSGQQPYTIGNFYANRIWSSFGVTVNYSLF
jgi:hypothetical protein